MRQNEALWKNVLLQELCSLLGFRLVACFLRCAFTLFSRAMNLWIAFEAAPVQACGTLHSRPSMSAAAALDVRFCGCETQCNGFLTEASMASACQVDGLSVTWHVTRTRKPRHLSSTQESPTYARGRDVAMHFIQCAFISHRGQCCVVFLCNVA